MQVYLAGVGLPAIPTDEEATFPISIMEEAFPYGALTAGGDNVPPRQEGQLQQSPQQPPRGQQQTQQPLNPGGSVSIVQGSFSLTTDAYSPNPIQVSVGGTVAWTNDDSQPHTATSGEDATPDGNFDSGIMAPTATFGHTFTEADEYPYFCLLHPNMVGTVSVS